MPGSRRMIAAGLIAVMLSGCAGAGSGHGSDEASSSGSEAAPGAGTAAIPDIGIPLAGGADAVSTSESGPLTVVQYIVPLAQRDAAIAFYDQWTESQDGEYRRTAVESGGVSWQNAPGTGGEKHLISVLSPIEGDDFVAITLAVGPGE